MTPSGEQSALRKAHDARPRDYEVVEDLNVHQGKRPLERPSENLVGMARFRDARGVVVGKDDSGGVRSRAACSFTIGSPA